MKNSEKHKLPAHIAIILDGNGRWAKRRGLPRQYGHRQGARQLREIVRHCRDIGIGILTVYAFSTENWSRPKEEIDGLMGLFDQYLDEMEKYREENVRLCFLGDRSVFSPELCGKMERCERESAGNTGIIFNVAVNYGGRQEIVRAATALAGQVSRGELSPGDIDEQAFAGQLYTAGQPDPDLVIRPSGEFRLSNFLLWQSAYAELVFMDILWPDFEPDDLDRALALYAERDRRFGGVYE